jgi:hypothetical protein
MILPYQYMILIHQDINFFSIVLLYAKLKLRGNQETNPQYYIMSNECLYPKK